MRKLDNYATFFTVGLGISGAVSLAALALTLDVLFSFRAFIFIFAVTTAVAAALIVFNQDEIREVEQDLRRNNITRDGLDLITKAKSMALTDSRDPEQVKRDVGEAVVRTYASLKPNAGSDYAGLESRALDN